jgi:hypothetical protein
VGSAGPAAITLGAGVVPNGSCKNFVMGIGGAKAGDGAVISTGATLAAGMVLYGVGVPADNQMTLKVCNFTGSASPAINNLPLRVMWF